MEILQKILGSFGSTLFIKNYWGKQMIHIRGSEDKFKKIIDWKDLNYILNFYPLRHPFIRIIKDGDNIPLDKYLELKKVRFKNTLPIHNILPDRISEILRSGATLILQDLHKLHPATKELAIKLELELGDSVQINGYLGWNNAKGFDIHYDSHDVIILQIFGNKKWFIYGSTEANPIKSFNVKTKKPENEPIFQEDISSGDLLYLPRGCWHQAEALSGPTFHLTIGIRRKTGIDYLKWFIENELSKSKIARANIPRTETSNINHIQKYEKDLKEFAIKSLSKISLDEYLLAQESSKKNLGTNFLPISVDLNFADDDLFKLNQRSARCVRKKSGETEFIAVTENILIPKDMGFLVKLMMTRDYFSLHEYLSTKSNLAADQLRAILRKMLENNILSVKIK